MAPSHHRLSFSSSVSTCCATCAALALVLAAASAPSPADALGVSPGSLSTFKITGGQELSETFGVAFGPNLPRRLLQRRRVAVGLQRGRLLLPRTWAAANGGKAEKTCVLCKVDDVYNPQGDASSSWQSGTVASSSGTSAQQPQQPQEYQNNYNNGINVAGPVVAAAATAALTPALVAETGHNSGPVIKPIVPIIAPLGGGGHKPFGGRRMMEIAAAA